MPVHCEGSPKKVRSFAECEDRQQAEKLVRNMLGTFITHLDGLDI